MFIELLADLVWRTGRESGGRLFIQTHNFPDADAVASAFGLKNLLAVRWGFEAELIYDGSIQRYSLLRMIKDLGIPIRHNSEAGLTERDRIIIVDGCKSYKNVTDLTGWEIAIVDHHEVEKPDDIPMADIRHHYGACSSIIAEYWRDSGTPLPRETATALLIGLLQDTEHLTRGVCDADIDMFNLLYRKADSELVSASLRNTMERNDLPVFALAINRLLMDRTLAFCYLPEGCPPALLGMLGDFLLSLEEVTLVTLFARNGDRINVSFRNEIPDINAAELIKDVLEGIGTGGGHREFAGGVVFNSGDFDERMLFDRIGKLAGASLDTQPLHYRLT
jgi:nanoRNase/pAp phosphatase (c-di-AMP/oligoRNAs hydrolase)